MANEIDFTLVADLNKATADLNRFSKNAGNAISGLQSSFKALAVAAGAVAGAFGVKKIVTAANEQENAIKSLNTALALSGEFTEENSKRFQEFASELQKNSTIGDEVSLSLVGLAKSMGATNDQTEKIIQAAADLSAVTGQSLESSVRNITKTLGGLKGELGETQPEIRNLTEEQLKAGAAIDILARKYEGAAKALTGTFSGAVTQAGNSFGDLLEEIGFLITKNPLIIEAVNKASSVFVTLGEVVKANRDSIIKFTLDAAANVARAFAAIVDAVGFAIGIFSNFEIVIDSLLLAYADYRVGVFEVADSIVKAFKGALNFGIQPLVAGFESVAAVLNTLGVVSDDQLAKFTSALNTLVLDSETSGFGALKLEAEAARDAIIDAGVESAKSLESFTDGFKKVSDPLREFADGIQKLGENADKTDISLQKLSRSNKSISIPSSIQPGTGPLAPEIIDAQRLPQIVDISAATRPFIPGQNVLAPPPDIFSGSIRGGGPEGSNEDPLITQMSPSDQKAQRDLRQDILSFGTNILSGLQSGNTAGVVAAGVGAGVDAVFPGVGQFAQAAISFLAQGPEAVRAQINAFVEELPVVIDAIVESIPVVIDALVDNSDKIIIALVKATPKITEAIAIGIPTAIALSFKENAPRIWASIREGFDFELNKLKESFNVFGDSVVVDFFKKFGTSIDTFFDGFYNDIILPILEPFQNLGENLNTQINEITGSFETFATSIGEGIVTAFENGIRDIFSGSLFQEIRDKIADIFNGIFGGGSGKQDVFTKGAKGFETATGIKLPKFADGGQVPAGFPNDSFPARLTSGENVIDRSTNEKLNAFLDNGGSNGGMPSRIVLQIGEKQLADVLLNINRQGFRTA